MGRYLVTGRGGSGKSTINVILLHRGYVSLDSDGVPSLAQWESIETGEPVEVDPGGFVDYSKVGWNWDDIVLEKLLSDNPELFLCGSASNQLPFHKLFDKVFMLMLDPTTHEARIRARNSSYGKHPETLKWILNEQQTFAQKAIELGGVAIDATGSPEDTVDKILGKIDV